MTPKQQRFVEEYLIDCNATQAAIRAGYSEKTAAVIGAENLTKPNIQEAVETAMQSRSERTEITQDWVIDKLVENVDRAMQASPVLDSEGRETGVYTYQGGVANQALALLAKHTGGFSDKHKADMNFSVTISERDAAGL